MSKVLPTGPDNADIMIVGEAPGSDEVARGEPFLGASGALLTQMLEECGIIRNECFMTNVCRYQPPRNKIDSWMYPKSRKPTDAVMCNGRWVHEHIATGLTELIREIELVKPKIIIALGNTALWALTGEYGITKWRGSHLQYDSGMRRIPVICTYHPAYIMRMWSSRLIAVHDLRKVKRILERGVPEVKENFLIRPSFDAVIHTIAKVKALANSSDKPIDIAVDLETKKRFIACCGFAWTNEDAICIPFLEVKNPDGNYWSTLDEELAIVLALRDLFTHPNVCIIGQNFPYDQQYITREWGFVPNLQPGKFWDTMTAGHTMFVELPKGLDFLSSFYLDNHVYWKDEGKEWNPRTMDEERLWVYNCKDCVRTLGVAQAQRDAYKQLNFKETKYGDPLSIQFKVHDIALRAMLRGVCVDHDRRRTLANKLNEGLERREDYINTLLGHPLNPNSPKQLQTLFYKDFNIKPVTMYDRATGGRRRTTNEAALEKIARREPLLAPICSAINEIRSLKTFRAFANQEFDSDARLRCQFIVPGTETFRFASRKDAFGFGDNLQNISSGNEGRIPEDSPFFRPNLRKMMVPDEGMVIGKFDGAQADARVVAWEAEEESLIELFNDPDRDLHNENSDIIFGRFDEPYRQKSKMGVHATNYGATARVVAMALGITVNDAEKFQARYFGERPKIKEWHKRVQHQLMTKRYVENVFGYRRYYFDRIDKLLKEALAWIPQSTVAISINLGIIAVLEDPEIVAQFLLQVHDEGDFQYPNDNPAERTEQIRQRMQVELPYDQPGRVIPIDANWSADSWGACK